MDTNTGGDLLIVSLLVLFSIPRSFVRSPQTATQTVTTDDKHTICLYIIYYILYYIIPPS